MLHFATLHSKINALFDRLDFDSSEPEFSRFDERTQYYLPPMEEDEGPLAIPLSEVTESTVRDLFLSLVPLATPVNIIAENGSDWLRMATMIDILYGIHLQYAARAQTVPEMIPIPRISCVGEDDFMMNLMSTRNDMGFILEKLMVHAINDFRVQAAAQSEGINLYEALKDIRHLIPLPHLALFHLEGDGLFLDAWLGADNFIESGQGWARMKALLKSGPVPQSSDRACKAMDFLLRMYQDLLLPVTADRLSIHLDNYRKLWS